MMKVVRAIWRRMGIGLLLPVVLALGSCTPDVSGTWLGTITMDGRTLRVVFNLTRNADDSYGGTADSPEEGDIGIPLTSALVNGRDVTLTVDALQAQFTGELALDGHSIQGQLQLAGTSLPLTVQKQPGPLDYRRPQDPIPPYPYRQQDVTFSNADAGVTLAGTLTWPKGPGPFKTVALITGSGAQNRNEEGKNHRPFLVLSDALTRAGIATLRWDDRGFGKSTGDFDSATTQDFASDVRSAVRYLRQQSFFVPSAIGLVGHSEGGIVGPMAADGNPDVAFLVLLAGPGESGDQIIIHQDRAIGAAMGVPPDQLDQQEALDKSLYACFYQTSDPAVLDQLLRAVLTQAGVTGAEQDATVAGLNTPWMRYFVTYDPIPVLKRTRIPVLALDGSLDTQVVADQNLPPIQAALTAAGNLDATTQKLPGLNHLFQHAITGSPTEYGEITETMAPEVLAEVPDWIHHVH
jgi:uncharacterized protein